MTLSEFNHELEGDAARRPTMMMTQPLPMCLHISVMKAQRNRSGAAYWIHATVVQCSSSLVSTRGRGDEDRCVTTTQRLTVLVESEGGSVALVAGVLVDVQCRFHERIIAVRGHAWRHIHTDGQMTRHPPEFKAVVCGPFVPLDSCLTYL